MQYISRIGEMERGMRKKIMQFAIFILSLGCLSIPAFAAQTDDTMMRVGLAYGNDARIYANLLNYDGYGEGYRFGYYDRDLSFVELGYTTSAAKAITMVRASDVYLSKSGGNSIYSMTNPGGSYEQIGCYHIRLSESFSDFAAAADAASNYSKGFPAWIDGEYQVRIGTYLTKEEAQSALSSLDVDGKIVGTSSYAINVFATGTSNVLFQFDGGSGSSLGVMPDVTGASKTCTWFSGYRYAGGFRYQRIGGGNLTVVNVVDLESYVKGVIPYEMNNAWPMEALKTQAVCARNYGMVQLNRAGHTSHNFDVCNTVDCQVYRGMGQANERTDQAVNETAGIFLWYKGALVETYYSSSFGGASENAYNVWGSSMSQYPYLCGVVDPYEELVANINNYSSWTRTFTRQELTGILQKNGYGANSSVKSVEAAYSPTGNVIKLIFTFDNGRSHTLYPNDMRNSNKYLGLPSIHFTVNNEQSAPSGNGNATVSINGNGSVSKDDELYVIDGAGVTQKADQNDLHAATGNGSTQQVEFESGNSGSSSGSAVATGDVFVFRGAGWGHNIGMSQYGAYAMAEKKGFDYDEILTFYFPGTNVSRNG